MFYGINMEPLNLNDILTATSGKLIQAGTQTAFTNVSTDSRTVNKNSLFFALVGERFDAHDFLQSAYDAGCRMFVVHKNIKLAPDSSVILVDNTLDALGNTARFYRQSLPAKVTAITGSNGKTTTKDILGAILSSNYKIAITEGTKNNLVGLPQTIFCADKSCRFLIVELGINHFGEMDRLASIAIPDIAIITNIGPSHLEFLHNEEGVCKIGRAHV